jgi:hypothetical protein
MTDEEYIEYKRKEKNYFPTEVKLVQDKFFGNRPVLMDAENSDYEASFLCTIGHPMSDYPESMLEAFGNNLVKFINERPALLKKIEELEYKIMDLEDDIKYRGD